MKNKNIFYIFHGRYPSEKAASLFAAKSVSAFAHKGVPITLIVPRRIGRSTQDPYTFYSVEHNFKIIYLPTIDLFEVPLLSRLAFSISNFVFSIVVFVYLVCKADKKDIIYSNEALPLFFASYFFSNTLYEVHDFPEKKIFLYDRLFKRVARILVTNSWKRDQLEKQFKVPEYKILCEPNAVEILAFDISLTKEQARTKLGLSAGGHVVVYTGHLYSWKGVDTLAQSAHFIEGITIFFIGGTVQDVAEFKKKYEKYTNISIIGHRPHTEVATWQKAADILILPNTAKEAISLHYTSPMKLFEYMASGRPIIASRIPSVMEILDDTNAFLCEADNPKELADSMKNLIEDSHLQNRLSKKAFEDVLLHSWDKRAQRIIGFLSKVV